MIGDRRAAVLSVLRELDRPTSVEEVATALDLHPNTARFHLRRLVQDGRVEQAQGTRGGRGRPRLTFRALTDRDGRNYLMLSRMLADAVTDGGGVEAAARTGHAWGLQLLTEAGVRPSRRPATVAAHLTTVLDSIGFAPQVSRDGEALDVDLRHCPFLEIAREQPGLVCGMHRALIQGVLTGLNSGMTVESLKPFVTPTLCTARVG